MPFKYLRDPLFLFCVVLYLANRLVLKPLLSSVFLHGYLNDVICIPFWVPIMLFLMRKCRLRDSDDAPKSYEILVPLVLWSIIFELFLPFTSLFLGLSVADHLDVLSYTCGSVVAGLVWRWYYRPQEKPSS